MKVTEMRQKSAEELRVLQQELLREQFNLRMQRGSGQISKNHRFKEIRRDIARIKTLMNEQTRVNPDV